MSFGCTRLDVFFFVMKMIFYQLFFLSFFLTCCGQRNTRNKNAIFGVPERFPSDSLPKELEMVRHFFRKQNEMKCSNAGRITLRAAAVEVSNTDLVIDIGWP